MSDESRGYPEATPWRDLWPHEQAAYWQHQARKHERRPIRYRRELQRFGIPTPDTALEPTIAPLAVDGTHSTHVPGTPHRHA